MQISKLYYTFKISFTLRKKQKSIQIWAEVTLQTLKETNEFKGLSRKKLKEIRNSTYSSCTKSNMEYPVMTYLLYSNHTCVFLF